MCSHGHMAHLPVWITLKKLREWSWMIIDRLYLPILCKWEMFELGGCPSWADPTRSNMSKIWGKRFLGVGIIKNFLETFSLILWLSHFFFQRTSERKVLWKVGERFLCCETRWFLIWLWFHSRLGLKIWTVKQFYWILDFFFKR